MSLTQKFNDQFDVWEPARPHIGALVTQEEMRLVVALDGDVLTPAILAARLGVSAEQAASALEAAWRRHVVDRKKNEAGDHCYRQGPFSERLNHFAKFGAWDALPEAARRALDQRFIAEFTERHRPNVERRMKGLPVESHLPNDAVLLLAEAIEMVEAATDIAVQPCDCRRLAQRCSRPVEVCVMLDAAARSCLERGYGKRLSRAEGVDLLEMADRKGLMHTADARWRERGLLYICNCCGCDCYPFRAAKALGSKGVWPENRFVARHDEAACTLCARCVKRCHFDAFTRLTETREVKGKQRRLVRYDADRCWGCGLCANTCPDAAIAMVPLTAGTQSSG